MNDMTLYNLAAIITVFLVPGLTYALVSLFRTVRNYQKEVEKLNKRVVLLEAKNKAAKL